MNLLEVNVTQNMSFIERVKEITKRLMEDLEHNSFSGVEVLRELSKVSEEKELLMPIVFTGVLKTDGTVGTIEYGFSHTPQVWIDCQIVDEIDSEDQEKGLMISWDTRKGAIKESIVTEMFESFTETIRILGIKHSEEWKNPLEIIVPSASKKKVICERNKGITNQSRIQQRFVKYAKKNSNKTAVIDAVETVTYGELLERAEYIAGYLRKEFVENRTGLVAIRMKKSVNQIAAVMGVLIAGFSYLPIDIKQPLARQEKILSKANVIVELDEKKVNMILQNLEYRLEKHPEFQNPIAYVIFTSGSTGEPKGVVMSHTAAQNTLISIENMYNISEEDTILGIAELSFDLSVFDIFSVLGVGGTLVLPNPEKGPDASHWGRLLNEYKVTLWNSVPAQAEMLDAFASKSESYPTVRLVLLSGDWINTSLPGRLRKIMTNAQMISLGGATEGGIWSIYHEIDEIEERPTILYGKALLGQWMGVVDEELRICPEYVSGQIAIGGYSLAEGYLGDTTLTKEKFVYVEEEKNRIYLTGDNGRYVENGDIEFLGRLDNQVKINGHRIEIAEIENAIRGMQNIEDCCVVYNQSIGKGVLIAFIKNKISSISYTKEEYRKQLAFFLPPAMIPSEFVNVERFPLSTNGKIDRKGLAESIQKNIKVKHNAKATLISQKKEYVELAKSIKKIVCSISGNDYIDYEDNLLENGLDSLLLSQISGRIVSDIQEAQGMRFDEILRASLTMPTIMGIAQYISDCKNPSKNQMHSNAGNQTRNSYTVVYIFGDNENEIRDVLIEKLSASNISCKRVGGQEIIERCHEDISVKKKYIIAFSEMASLCITKASELLGENIIINRIFLINPSKAKESDLYLGDISIIDGNSVAIKSWEKAVLGNVREFESNRSRLLSKNLNVPMYTDIKEINQNVDAACVVVPNAAGGGNGANIAKSILAKGIPTLLEHPAHEVEIVNCIRESGSAAFMLNPFYRYIKPIRDFLEAAQIISKHAHLINASLECAIHVLYDGIDILGCALGGLSTWKLGNVAESYTTSMAGGGNRVISGIIGMVPVTFIVNTNVDRNDIDHPLHLYHRIELTFSTGRLCLVNTHGPVIWLPFLHMPRDEYGTLSINVEEEVNIPSGVTIGNVMLPSVKETFEQIWPDAVKKALEILFKQNRTEKMSMAQYQIYVSKLWSEICQKVGYMNIVDYDNFGDIKSIFYDLEKRHLIKKENDGIE